MLKDHELSDLNRYYDATDNTMINKKGFQVSRVGILMYCLLTVVIAVVVGLIVYYAHPDRGSCICDIPEPTKETGVPTWDESQWELCVNMSRTRNECLPVESCPITTMSTVAPTTEPSQSINDESLRLPTTFKPFHYDIELKPDIYQPEPDDFSFTGHVYIHLECASENDTVFVHYRKMMINESKTSVKNLQSGDDMEVIRQDSDRDREFFKITVGEMLGVGDQIVVYLEFSGPLARDGAGMFWSSYGDEPNINYMIATQLAITDARKTFPCLDEPDLRATFNLTLLRKPEKWSLANMPLYATENRGDDWLADKFEKTNVTMPTYLVAFAVCDHTYIDDTATGGLTDKYLQYWSRPEFIDAGYMEHSRQIGGPVFDVLESYFNHPFNMPKTAMITVTDIPYRAMENWGLITYQESRLLNDSRYSTIMDIQVMSGTLAHELVHMWLGNVVTCKWWSETWLQEGNARFFQHLGLQPVTPNWNLTYTYMTQVFYKVLHVDDSGAEHPLHNIVYTPGDIDDTFSSVTYDKGSAVIRMAQKLMFMDDESFRDAYRKYIDQMQYNGSMYYNLFENWDMQAQLDGISLKTNFSVWGDTWIKQMGYPVLTFERSDNGNEMTVSQQMFLEYPEIPIEPRYPSLYGYKWEIPFMYITEDDGTPEREWIHVNQDSTTFTLNNRLEPTKWFLGNYHHYGFFRTNYDEGLWENIKTQLNDDHTVFDPVHRGQILDDSLSLAKAGNMSQVTALELTEYLSADDDYLAWYAADFNLKYVDDMLYWHTTYGDFRKYMANLVKNNFETLGWDFDWNDALTESYVRALVIEIACRYDNAECVENSMDLFAQYYNDKTNFDIIPPDVRQTVYCIAIRDGPDQYWDFMFDLYVNVDHQEERIKLRDALACSSQLWRLSTYFQMVMNYDERIHYKDPSSIVRAVARNRVATSYVWQYLDANWDTVMPSKTSILSDIAVRFSTEYQLQEFNNFVSKHPADSSSVQRTYDRLRYKIQGNIRWKKDNLESVSEWVSAALGRQ